MTTFLSSLKKSGHLDNIKMTIAIVGSRKLGSEDYATQGWDIFAPNLTIYGFDADKNECDRMNAELKAKGINWTEKHIPLGLWNTSGTQTLYLTQFPGCSSLYPPSEAYRERYIGNSEMIKLVGTEEIETTTLDAFCKAEGISAIDFIQVDTQGGDLNVLKGGEAILKSILAIVVEVEFTQIYDNQPLFSDVDSYLKKQGFTLADLAHIHRDYRRRSPLLSQEHPGQLVWADAYYFRDLIKVKEQGSIKPEQLLKLACIADILDFPDYALEILEYLTLNYGSNKQYNFATNIIKVLAQYPSLSSEKFDSLPIVARLREYLNSQPTQQTPPQLSSSSQANKKLRIGIRLEGIGTFDINKPETVQEDEIIARGWHKYLMRQDDVESVYLYGSTGKIEEELDVMIHFNPFLELHPGVKNILYLQNVFPKDRYSGGIVGVFRMVKARFDGYIFTSEKLMKGCADGAVVPFATDPELFFPQPSSLYEHPVTFVGNDLRGAIVNQRYFAPALPFGLVIYGNKTWASPLSTVYRGQLPIPDLPKLYASCQINLNAHIQEQADWDTINPRIYDILACGGFVLSDSIESLPAVFGDTVVYTDGNEDEWAKIVQYLADSDERKKRASEGRKLVLSNHSYAHRMESVTSYLKEVI